MMNVNKIAAWFVVPTFLAASLFGECASAQSDAQVEAFNEAWNLHKSVRADDDVDIKVATALDALEIGQSFLPENDERLAMLKHNYGTMLLEAGRNYEAREVLLDALHILEAIHGKHSLELLETIKAAADAWGGHPDFATRHLSGYKRALKIVERHYGKDSLEYADLSMEAGARVYDLSRSPIGDYRLRTALEIYERHLPSPDVRRGAAAFYLGKIRLGSGKTEAAIEFLEESLLHFEEDTDVQRLNRLRSMSLLVQAYDKMRQPGKVDQYAERIGREIQYAPDIDLYPLITVNPAYPRQFEQRGIEGYVVVEFSVDQQGRVVNPRVIETDHRFSTNAEVSGSVPRPGDVRNAPYDSLEEAAIEAVSQYRFAPRYVDGRPVFVSAATIRIDFDKQRVTPVMRRAP